MPSIRIMFREEDDQANFLTRFSESASIVSVENYHQEWVEITAPYRGRDSLDDLRFALNWIRGEDMLVQYIVIDVDDIPLEDDEDDKLLTTLGMEVTLLKSDDFPEEIGRTYNRTMGIFKSLQHSMVAKSILRGVYVSDDEVEYSFNHSIMNVNQIWMKKP